jgi:RNA polymerase sigma-70 factor, ECF subfamily
MDFETFVREHQDMVYSTALRIVGSPQDAEDIAQNVFIKAYSDFKKLADNPQAGGWLRTLARNEGINHYNRYQKRWKFFSSFDKEDGDSFEPASPETDDGWLYGQFDVLKKALLELPAKFRAPLVLYHYEDCSYDEISKMLKVSIDKVKVDIHRGRAMLKKKIMEIEQGEDGNQEGEKNYPQTCAELLSKHFTD